MDVEREKLIGSRLRAFRDTLQIPRTKFAFSVGCGSEQFAAYEAGRARLPYLVFRLVTGRYFLNPFWLAWGSSGGSPSLDEPFDDSSFIQQVRQRSLFSDIFDRFIVTMFQQLQQLEKEDGERFRQILLRLKAKLLAAPDLLDERDRADLEKLAVLGKKLKENLVVRSRIQTHLNKMQEGLDINSPVSDTATVKAKIHSLSDLLKAVRERVSERGQKTALARKLNVSRQAVDQWLSGDAKPSAELTFKLLNWVESPARKQ